MKTTIFDWLIFCMSMGRADTQYWLWAGQTHIIGYVQDRHTLLVIGRTDTHYWLWAGQTHVIGYRQGRHTLLVIGRTDTHYWL
mgnify:CR=1 FL=1